MSLTATDLQGIRKIVREEVGYVVGTQVRGVVQEEVKREVGPLAGTVEALENDVKEIYFMLSRLEQGIVAIAKQTGSKLPRFFTKPYNSQA